MSTKFVCVPKTKCVNGIAENNIWSRTELYA